MTVDDCGEKINCLWERLVVVFQVMGIAKLGERGAYNVVVVVVVVVA